MMTVMTDAVDTAAVAKKKTSAGTPEGVDAEMAGRLVEQARAAGLRLTGEGGQLQQLTAEPRDRYERRRRLRRSGER